MSHYAPLPEISASLTKKVFVMIIGPTAIGKSSIMNEVARLDPDFRRVSGFTTRAPRENDEPGLYRYLTDKEAEALIQHHQAVQYIRHPTTGMIYGTEAFDYPGDYNLKDTLTEAVKGDRELPFARTVTVSITTDPATWQRWLEERFPEDSDERTKRLRESKQSIEWSLAQTGQHQWLINTAERLSESAQELIRCIRDPALQTDTPSEATKLLAMANDLLSY